MNDHAWQPNYSFNNLSDLQYNSTHQFIQAGKRQSKLNLHGLVGVSGWLDLSGIIGDEVLIQLMLPEVCM